MMTITCMNCKHYDIDKKCAAFKRKIPDVIWEGEDDHDKPLKNQDNDLVFTEIESN